MSDIFQTIVELFHNQGGELYMISEPITQLEHALQTYVKMKEMGGDCYARVAALLHDIGHLLCPHPLDPTDGINDQHEIVGGKWLMLHGFDHRVYIPVMMHVEAKRYLCAVKSYPLSKGSQLSLQLQGGPMKDLTEQRSFERSSYFSSAVLVRSCDDRGKEIDVTTLPSLESLREEVMSTIIQ